MVPKGTVRVAIVVAVASFFAAAIISCAFGPSTPKVGDKGGYCSAIGSVKADKDGKWSCEPDDPNSPDSTKHWVKVG